MSQISYEDNKTDTQYVAHNRRHRCIDSTRIFLGKCYGATIKYTKQKERDNALVWQGITPFAKEPTNKSDTGVCHILRSAYLRFFMYSSNDSP